MAGQNHKIIGHWVIHNLYKRDTIWYGRIRNTITGKIRCRSTRESNKRRAEKNIFDWIHEIEEHDNEEIIKGPLFKVAFREWLDLKSIRPSTKADYEYSFKGIYTPAFGNKYVDEIKFKDIEYFLKKLEKKRKSSSRTRQKHLTKLRSFFQWAVHRNYIVKNPTLGIKVPRGPKRMGMALSVEETRRLVQACQRTFNQECKDSRRSTWTQKFQPPEHLFTAVLIAIHTGLRRGNIVSLTWKEINLNKGCITIPAEKMKANADHQIPLHRELITILKKRFMSRKILNLDSPVIGEKMLEISASFRSALKRADLPMIRWHDLRHTFATWLSSRCSYSCLRQLLGHSPGNIITLHYTHVPFEELKRAIDSMPSLLSANDDSYKETAICE